MGGRDLVEGASRCISKPVEAPDVRNWGSTGGVQDDGRDEATRTVQLAVETRFKGRPSVSSPANPRPPQILREAASYCIAILLHAWGNHDVEFVGSTEHARLKGG